MYDIQKGDTVYWNDPDADICSGKYQVTEIKGEFIYLINDHGSEVQALITECTKIN